MSKRVLTAAAALLVASTTVPAAAEDTGSIGATLEWPRLKHVNSDGELDDFANVDEMLRHLNLASCICSKESTDVDTDLYYELGLSDDIQSTPGELFVGADCTDDDTRDKNCRLVGTVGDLNMIRQGETNVRYRFYDIVNARPDQEGTECREVDGGSGTVWVTADTDRDSDPDFFSPRPADLDLFDQTGGDFDTKAPDPLNDVAARSGENSIEITWDTPDTNNTDFYAFQALCTRMDGSPVTDSPDSPLYVTTTDICGLETSFELDAATGATIDEGTAIEMPPEGSPFARFDHAFICGTVEQGTATSLRIEGLENEVEYAVALLAIDRYGNARGTFVPRSVIPHAVTDFWEDIHDRGGKVEGGLCATGGSAGSFGLVALALGLIALRGRRRAIALPLAVLALGGAPRIAAADDITPYWEQDGDQEVVYDDGQPTWIGGIKLGPYVPAIDDQIGRNATTNLGPYEAMFGAKRLYQVLPVLELDRIVWSQIGQVAVGASIGYMQKKGRAYLEETSADDIDRGRSSSRNTFRLIPFALTASYRLTQLDDLYGIPLVPYLRGGLSYYVWWIKGPNGDLAKICTDGMSGADCEGNKAYGGSLGFQGTVGLAIRAERIDPAAARSMRQSGIYHAGFYAELTSAVVNGFGSDSKLSVGDTTWFAGANFEF